MRAAIYNPYWDTLGGGERYTASFTEVLVESGHTVDIEWKEEGLLKALNSRFGIKLDNTKIVKDIKKGEGYDICFWVSDGSIPLLHSRKNFIHFQVPFNNINGKSLLNKMKLFRVNKVITNSEFTKNIIDREFGIKSFVIYPPVDVFKIKAKRKENIILSVGRFSQLLQSKHQDILVDAFAKLCKEGLRDWKLILAGGKDVGADEVLEKLKLKAGNYPIEIFESVDYKTIVNLYGISKIFWSASGYGENEVKDPEKVEHFGITLVESMAGGCVPLAFNAGGHKEIIKDGESGYLWKEKKGLLSVTRKLIGNNKLLKSVSKNSKLNSNKFNYDVFRKKIESILQD